MSDTSMDITYRAFHIRIGLLGFVAAAERHRGETHDHYCIAYRLLSDNDDMMAELERLEEKVKKDDTTEIGFSMRLTKRGRQSALRLGKLILAHILMDLVSTRVYFGVSVYDYIIKTDTVDTSLDILVGDTEEEDSSGE